MEEDKIEVHLIGKITSDVEAKKSASGVSWCSISVESIVNGFKSWNRLTAFKNVADDLAKNARKGKRIKILANASMIKNKRTDNYETNLTIYKFKVLDEEKEQPPVEQPKPQPEKADVPKDDDLPF